MVEGVTARIFVAVPLSEEARVVLTGATSDSTLVVDAVRLVQTVPGVAGVESRIRYVDFHAPGW